MSTSSSTTTQAVAPRRSPDVRLDFLDGLRGLAALYVVLGHACVSIREQFPSAAQWPPAAWWFIKATDLGHYAVAVFIVLSGYCLMLPVARSADGILRGGARGYLMRRARRILPPYYAALVVSIGLMVLYGHALHGTRCPGWDPAESLQPAPIVSHLLLVHNLTPAWVQTINGPMWSVALEWQIYFFFPLLLLPVWRRWGAAAAAASGLAVGLAPLVLLPTALNLAWTYTWYLGLFAIGMAAAVVSFSPSPGHRAFRRWRPLGWAVAIVSGAVLAALLFELRWMWTRLWLSDPIVGATTALLIVFCARAVTETPGGPRPWVLKALSLRGPVVLGAFSYSLYLVHLPLMRVANHFLAGLPLGPLPRLALQLAVVVPVLVALAYLFHLAFEKPFMPEHWRKRKGTA